MYNSSGAKSRQPPATVKSSIYSAKFAKNVMQPTTQSRALSASLTKTTTTLRTSRIAAIQNRNIAPEKSINHDIHNKSKFTVKKSTTQPSQIPCINNTNTLKPTKSSKKSTSEDTIASKLSRISKCYSRKDTVDKTLKSNNQNNQFEFNKPLIGTINRSKLAIAKTSNHIRSLSATTTAANRLGNRKRNVSLTRQQTNENFKTPDEELITHKTTEMSIQTNENEIMNHSLIVGDLKIMKPSKSLVEDIEKLRQDIKIKKLLKSTRKFEEHSAKDEKHLNDLNEYLEKSYITKRDNKVRGDLFEEDHKLITTMDQLLNREIPKTESISDIKARIKRKEQELLSLFDKVPKIDMFGN